MEILLLFLACLAFAVALGRLAGRVKALEEEVERLGGDTRGAFPARPEARAAASPPWDEVPARAAATARPPAPATTPVRARGDWVGAEAGAGHEAPAPAAARETLGGLFERFVGGRLLIWAGGIALAVAGLFLVRYSIQIGLVTPAVQMGLAALFGFVLLGLGEWARSRPGAASDPRVAQALVGAAILVLYAAAYGAFIVHHLIGRGTASSLLTMMTGLGLILSLRHGAPTALMGLAGGFATPLLIGDAHSGAVPLLAYLALLDIAVFALATRRGWSWLVASAVLLSFAWTLALLFLKPADGPAVGVFILLVSLAASTVRAGPGWQLEFIRPAAIGIVQLALLVASSETDSIAWALFGGLALATFLLAGRRPEYRPIPALALLAALLLLFVKAALGADSDLPWVAAAITALFAGGGAWNAARRPEALLWTGIASAAFLFPALILRVTEPARLGRPLWGLLFVALAAGPVLLGWLRARRRAPDVSDRVLAVAGLAALLLAGLGVHDLAPEGLVPAGWLALALLAAAAARRLDDRGLSLLALLAALAATLRSAASVPGLWEALGDALGGAPALASTLPGPLRATEALLLPALLLASLWRLVPSEHGPGARRLLLPLAGALALAAAYILFKRLYGLDSAAEFVARGFAERTIVTQALFAAGWAICRGFPGLPGLDARQRWWAGIALTALAAARLVWFDLLVDNPLWRDQNVGALPVLNLLVPAYLLSACWLYAARRGAAQAARSGLWLALSLASLVFGATMLVRQAFQGPILTAPALSDSESYSYSAAGLLLSIALLLSGIRLPDKALRLAGLVLLTATAGKVFLVDAAALEGVLRIVSFLGLGVALILIGMLYTKVLNAEAAPAADAR
ncbi:MAG: DUF2339 domain-containing protein [Alphaproteobacteria bacterium]|nr:DUF2339 domain-containing protein [Alphaproteobacteria bacterium]MBV9371166.1 DUF2339 domain-containing protein [Alphaproteobacteria bacterium]MBV9901189.1 DUF2339 domain-containing protein [Alphaproteobacteria bacterium]